MRHGEVRQEEESILVVDDEALELRMIASILNQAGYRVRTAPSGELALESTALEPPTLILLDIRMPGLDGFEVCRRLKADPATAAIPVIFVSGMKDPQEKICGYALGCVDYITKPFVKEEILAQVDVHFRLCRARKELEVKNCRLQAEVREREMTISLLDQVGTGSNLHEMIDAICRLVQAWTGCESIGVLLRRSEEGFGARTRGVSGNSAGSEDIPGLIDAFGPAASTKAENPVLESLCRDILTGRFTPPHPCFTPGGSFWDNGDTLRSASLAQSTGLPDQPGGSGGCGSVALVPLRQGSLTFGLLQCRDRRPGRFTPDSVAHLERLAGHLAIALRQRLMEEALQCSEERFRTIVTRSPDHVLVQNADLRYVSVTNPQLGLTEREMLGKTDLELRPGEEGELLTQIKREVLATGTPVRKLLSLTDRDGRRQWFEGDYVPKYDSSGKVDGLIGYFRRVTERVVAEEQLRQVLKEKELLLSELRHRVKNSLSIVSGLLRAELPNLTDERPRKVFVETCSRINSISVAYQLLVAQGSGGQVDLGLYLQNMADSLVKAYADPKGVRLAVRAESIGLDLRRALPLGLAVNELVTNALKYGCPPDRESEIRLTLTRQDGWVALRVGDDGPGLPADLDPGQSPNMGLPLVRMLTQQLEGRFCFEPGPGVTACLTFPE